MEVPGRVQHVKLNVALAKRISNELVQFHCSHCSQTCIDRSCSIHIYSETSPIKTEEHISASQLFSSQHSFGCLLVSEKICTLFLKGLKTVFKLLSLVCSKPDDEKKPV